MIRHAASYPETPRAADFRDEGACLSHDPEMWFPKNQGAPEKAKAAQAKRICGICPVRTECLAYALKQRVEFGIFGGLDEDERRALRRRASKAAAKPKKPEPAPEPVQLPRWSREPEPCGTRSAYRRHRKNGETPCDACRAANSAADRRLRETGTTKALTS